jgi:hypothetical protein
MNNGNQDNTNPNSAAHWCKAVIEDAVPTLKSGSAALLTPQSLPGSYANPLAQTAAAAQANTLSASLNPAYLQYYQQYYNPPPVTPIVTPAVSSIPSSRYVSL